MKPNLRLDLRLDPRSGCQLNFTQSGEPRSNYYNRLGYRLLALPVEPCPDLPLMALPPSSISPLRMLAVKRDKPEVVNSAVQCSAVQCSAVQCSAVQCSAVHCTAVQSSVVQSTCRAVKYNAMQYSAVQHSAVLQCIGCSAEK